MNANMLAIEINVDGKGATGGKSFATLIDAIIVVNGLIVSYTMARHDWEHDELQSE